MRWLMGLALVLAGCTTLDREGLRALLRENPDLVFEVLREHPEEFARAGLLAQERVPDAAALRAQMDFERQVEEELKHPTPVDPRRLRHLRGRGGVLVALFSDFQCPYCRRAAEVAERLRKEYGDRVTIAYKHLPLKSHRHARLAARYYEAVALQSAELAHRFHDELYANQGKIAGGAPYLREAARAVGADMDRLQRDLASGRVDALVDADVTEANSLGFTGTPGMVIGGVRLDGAYPYEAVKYVVDRVSSPKP